MQPWNTPAIRVAMLVAAVGCDSLGGAPGAATSGPRSGPRAVTALGPSENEARVARVKAELVNAETARRLRPADARRAAAS